MKLTIVINLDNAAFGETDEERDIELHRIISSVDYFTEEKRPLKDINGNTVGHTQVTP